jgi:hypothetical protein
VVVVVVVEVVVGAAEVVEVNELKLYVSGFSGSLYVVIYVF